MLGAYRQCNLVDYISNKYVACRIVGIFRIEFCDYGIFACVFDNSVFHTQSRHKRKIQRSAVDIGRSYEQICFVDNAAVVIVTLFDFFVNIDNYCLGIYNKILRCVFEYNALIGTSCAYRIITGIDYFFHNFTARCISVCVFKVVTDCAVHCVHMIESVVFAIVGAAYRAVQYEFLNFHADRFAISDLIVFVAVHHKNCGNLYAYNLSCRHTLRIFAVCSSECKTQYYGDTVAVECSCVCHCLTLAENIVIAVEINYLIAFEGNPYRYGCGSNFNLEILVDIEILCFLAYLYAAVGQIYIAVSLIVNIRYAAVNRQAVTCRRNIIGVGSECMSSVCIYTVFGFVNACDVRNLLRSVVIQSDNGTFYVFTVVNLGSSICRIAFARHSEYGAFEFHAASVCHDCRKIESVILTVGNSQNRYGKPNGFFTLALFEHKRRHNVLFLVRMRNLRYEFA